MTTNQPLTEALIIYPESDGQPMAENTEQFRWIVMVKENLEALFQDRPDVFVAGDLLWYPVEGRPDIRRAPDAMVVFGRPKGRRGSYLQWQEDNIAPQVVFEILSPGNTVAEMAEKLDFYDRYGVKEYYIYNPDSFELTGMLRTDDKLHPHHPMDGWISPLLNIRFDLSAGELRIYHPNARLFLSFVELEQQAHQAEQQAAEAKQQQAIERLARQQAEQRATEAEQRAEQLAARLRELGIDPNKLDG